MADRRSSWTRRLLFLLTVFGPAQGQQLSPLPPEQVREPSKLSSELEALLLDPVQASKVDPRLRGKLSPSGEAVQVDILLQNYAVWEAERLQSDLGLETVFRFKSEPVVSVRVPVHQLRALSEHPGIRYLRTPPIGYPTATQGVDLTGARTNFHDMGFQGRGVRVAVIDLGFDRLDEAIQRGALPAGVVRRNLSDQAFEVDAFGERESHGVSVAEIVHAMAPEADLYLYKISTLQDLVRALEQCRQDQIQVVNHSVAWFNQSFYDGSRRSVNELIEDAVDSGMFWVNSGGNYAQHHYTGGFVDDDGDSWHEFSNGDETIDLTLASDTDFSFYLTWNSWESRDADYDLHLFRDPPEGDPLCSSVSRQVSTGADPTESLGSAECNIRESGTYHVAIRKVAGNTEHQLTFFLLGAQMEERHRVAEGSIPDPTTLKVFSVGAVDISNWASGITARYSSRGPTAAGAIKPDLCGPTGVDTAIDNRFFWWLFSLGSGFQGTSAAAPHVAGAAALFLQRFPGSSPHELRVLLEGNASARSAGARDTSCGAGRLSLPRSPLRPDLRIISGIRLLQLPPYYINQQVTIEFSVANRGTGCLHLSNLAAGGRDPGNSVRDFPPVQNLVLCDGEPYRYTGSISLTAAGPYHFFPAYQTHDGEWNTSLPADAQPAVLDLTVLSEVPTPEQGRSMDFEDGRDGQIIRSTIPGMTFTTTDGFDWAYGDWRTGDYNGKHPDGEYTSNGSFFAWLGRDQGTGRIDFTGASARSVRLSTSNAKGLSLEAYDNNGKLVDSDSSSGNTDMGRMDRLEVDGTQIAYVLVHDQGNFWLIDDLEVVDLLSDTISRLPTGFGKDFEEVDTISPGGSKIKQWFNSVARNLRVILGWPGSELGFRVFKPDGSLYGEYRSDTPPITVDIPVADSGQWRFEITAVDVPNSDYPFAFVVGSEVRPTINAGGVVDAASFRHVVAPGGIATLFGEDFADVVATASQLPLPTELASVRVMVNGVLAPLFFVSSTQINFQVPFDVSAADVLDVIVLRAGVASPPVSASVAEYGPAIFLNPNSGEPIIQRHPDGQLVTRDNPARPGDVLIVYLTGIGGLTNAPVTGAPASASPLSASSLTPIVTLGATTVDTLFAGLVPFFVGLAQVNIQLPTTLPTGTSLPLLIRFGNQASQVVEVAVGPRDVPRLEARLFTNVVPGQGCAIPEPVNSFLTTAARVYAWFLVDGIRVGDRPRLDWHYPDGRVYQTATWEPVPSAGARCFWAWVDIAGFPPGSIPGTWRANAYWNEAPFFSQTFTIIPPGTATLPAVLNRGTVVAGTVALSEQNHYGVDTVTGGPGVGSPNDRHK